MYNNNKCGQPATMTSFRRHFQPNNVFFLIIYHCFRAAYFICMAKTCFHCGEKGHVQPECTLHLQSDAGREAFRQYQKAWLAEKKKKRSKPKNHHFLKFQQWMQTYGETGVICDPLVCAAQHIIALKGKPQSFEWTKMVQLSYKEMFMDILERTRMRFSGVTTKRDHDDLWEQALNQAVKAGEPADFSQIEANRVYADNKLIFRTRYLFHLLMDDNPLSIQLRETLLPAKVVGGDSVVKRDGVKVASIGGGPVRFIT